MGTEAAGIFLVPGFIFVDPGNSREFAPVRFRLKFIQTIIENNHAR